MLSVGASVEASVGGEVDDLPDAWMTASATRRSVVGRLPREMARLDHGPQTTSPNASESLLNCVFQNAFGSAPATADLANTNSGTRRCRRGRHRLGPGLGDLALVGHQALDLVTA